jgi:hypothetical protein
VRRTTGSSCRRSDRKYNSREDIRQASAFAISRGRFAVCR